jgi:hypothetical protein
MSVEFITGKPGGGKSILGMRQIINELVSSNRYISTNLAIDVNSLRHYLHSKYNGQTFRVEHRLRILTMQECSEFWLYRYRDIDINPDLKVTIKVSRKSIEFDSDRRGKNITVVDYEGQGAIAKGGVLFVIDEIHTYFNARNWQSTGEDALYYLSQHRKFGDDVICITQHTKQVETQFSRLAEFFYFCRNTRKLKLPIFGGVFKAPSSLIVSQYDDIAVKGAPLSTRVYTVDAKGVGSCYRTAAGVGFVGGSADTEHKAKGLPWWGLCLVLAGLGFVLTKGVGWAVHATLGSKHYLKNPVAMQSIVSTNQTQRVSLGGEKVDSAEAPGRFNDEELHKTLEGIERRKKELEPQREVWVTGKAVIPLGGGRKKIVVFLSDGRKFTSEGSELQGFGNNGEVMIAGKVYTDHCLDCVQKQSEQNREFQLSEYKRQLRQ